MSEKEVKFFSDLLRIEEGGDVVGQIRGGEEDPGPDVITIVWKTRKNKILWSP